MTQKRPQKAPLTFMCELCDYSTRNKKYYTKHLTRPKHLKSAVFPKNPQENPKNEPSTFICELCDYSTSNKKYYTKHLTRPKHLKRTIIPKNPQEIPKKDSQKDHQENPKNITHKFICKICDYNTNNKKDYNKHLYSSKHKKNETNISNITLDSSSNDVKILTGLVIELVKSNNDLQKQVLEICKNSNTNNSHNNNHNTNTNSHNKTFNLQFFLNEECKDAMNLSEFINTIQPKLSDLENIGKVGYVEGVSNIIIEQLNKTHVNKRPVHCSDAKRETLYVKEEDKWEKDTDETKKMVKAVKDVSKKTSNLLVTDWKDANPEFMNSKSKQSEKFTNLACEISSGDETNVSRVIKNVAKQVVIDK